MKPLSVFTLFTSVIFTVVLPVYPQNICAPINTVVYFGNGVGSGVTTFHDAVNSMMDLEDAFMSELSSIEQEKYSLKLAFNHSGGKLEDVLECALQTFGNEWPTLLVAFILRDSRILNLIPDDIKTKFNDFLTNTTIQELVAPGSSNSDVYAHVQSYESDIGEGKKVILVAHSQGNIFANLAFQRIQSSNTDYFTIIPVASPESFVRKSLVGHIRFSDDLVIMGVEIAKVAVGLAAPMAQNDEDDIDADFLSHGFSEAYLADISSRSFIVQAIFSSENALPTPVGIADQGTITITLTWGSNPDVDLHIYEPTGNHVYYANKNGNFGYLDVDDVTSYGPEHYYVSCETLINNSLSIGRYRFGVNYYYGYSSETATITVKTPTSELTRSVLLTDVMGSSGNNNMIPVADVIVSKDSSTGQFNFSIQ